MFLREKRTSIHTFLVHANQYVVCVLDTKCCKNSGNTDTLSEAISFDLHRHSHTPSFRAQNGIAKTKLITWLLDYGWQFDPSRKMDTKMSGQLVPSPKLIWCHLHSIWCMLYLFICFISLKEMAEFLNCVFHSGNIMSSAALLSNRGKSMV